MALKYIHLLDKNITINAIGEGGLGKKGSFVSFREASAEVVGWKTARVKWHPAQGYVCMDRNVNDAASDLALISF